MENNVKLIFDIVLALFSFGVVAPVLLNAYAQFTVQKSFCEAMVDEGVISAERVRQMLPKKQAAGVLISVIVLIAMGVAAVRMAPYGYLCAGVPLLAGFWKYRKAAQFNSFTVQRFQATFRDEYDAEKLKQYTDAHF